MSGTMSAPPVRRPAPAVNAADLSRSFVARVEEVGSKKSFVLGHCEFLGRDCAVHARSLHHVSEL
eukprot:1363817-Pyramimonas_sp.AAC.1